MSESMKNLKKMNKKALEEYGRTVGIELDRRLTKKALVKQMEEYLDADYEISVSGDKATGDALVSRLADALEVAHANEGNEEALTSIHETRRVVSQKVLLRNKHTGHFSKGPQPAGASNGRSGGVPYWEI
jgi:uncharacterized protein (DUF2164 family)